MERKKKDDLPVKPKKAVEETPKAEPKRKPVGSIYGDLDDVDEEYAEPEEDLDDGDEEYQDPSFFQKYKMVIILGVVVALAGAVALFMYLTKEEPAPPPPAAPVEEVDPAAVAKDELYKLGIGKEAVNEQNIYEQGSLTSEDFRKDFTNQSATEIYKTPIEIMSVTDSVSYTKYRTQTDDGIDVHWVDAVYKDKSTVFTVPYYIWRTLANQGVMDVIVETVTDADGKVFVSSITAKAPTTK